MPATAHKSWTVPNVLLLAAFVLAPSAVQAQNYASEPEFNLGIGASFLHIDDLEFTAITDFFVTEVQDHQSNHDGEFLGYKLNGEIDGLMQHQRGQWLASLAFKGFYAHYEDEQNSRCVVFEDDSECVFVPLVDPDPDGTTPDVSGGLFSDWITDVSRSVVHWGSAVELRLDKSNAPTPRASLKDTPAPAPKSSSLEWRAGLAFRRFDQDVFLYSVDVGPTQDPVTLTDDLNTNYYGAYFGFRTQQQLVYDTRLKLSGETGLYFANTDYVGNYTATESLGDENPIAESVALTDSAAAFIGSLNISLEQDYGSTTVALFGEAEWMSYVPKVLYNDTDRGSVGGVFDVIGTQDGTELGEGSALSFTLGARVSMPLQ